MRKLISCNYSQDEVNPLLLMQVIQQNILKIQPQLVGDLTWYSQDARFVPDSLKIISVDPLGSLRYKMRYQFTWNIFNACLDIDAGQTVAESVCFQIIPGHLVFELIDNHYPTTADEL